MIRDPSDGSVRHEPPSAPVKTGGASVSRRDVPEPGPDTGIRQPTRTDAQERLERSRQWLKDYHASKETEHARGSSSEQELSPAGNPIDDQWKA